jgi:hypothetical protein
VAPTVNGDEQERETPAEVEGVGPLRGLRECPGSQSPSVPVVLGGVEDPGGERSRSVPLIGDWIWGDTLLLSDGVYEWRVILW